MCFHVLLLQIVLGQFGIPSSGNAAGFGTGNAGLGGASATGVGTASSSNGAVSSGSGQGSASVGPFGTFQTGGQGSGTVVGK